MDADELIKKQKETIEKLQEQLSSFTNMGKVNEGFAQFKTMADPQVKEMEKTAEQLQNVAKQLEPLVKFMSSPEGKEAAKKYFGKS